ncbi:YadA-like family protein [Mitsuokella multacida]|uniref:YadA-like family protein n=1 Tax=Mitsuokella multacida TaxID=52226 RepID=UPI0022DE9C3F|nr:YadA-like family protein [Mitsuokella multacida]
MHLDCKSIGFKIPTGWHIHSNAHAKQNLPESIAVGTNSYARTGSIEIGAHTLAENKISIGDTTADQLRQFGVASTTLGTNSYAGGGFATTIGSYNVQSNKYEAKDSDDTLQNATKNAFSTIIGTFNSNESIMVDAVDEKTGKPKQVENPNSTSGVANMISGTANKVTNSNGTIVMGAGNSVKNSIDYFDTSSYSSLFNSAADMQKALMDGVASSAGGATLVIGGANQAENTSHSQIMGVKNSVKGSREDAPIQYNYLDGFESSITDASHVKVLGQQVTINKGADSNTVFGDYRTVAEGQTNNVIIGNADEKKPITTEKKETVILGYNANAKVDGGVALGAGSVSSLGSGVPGYDPSKGDHSKDTSGIWKSTAAAVSIGDASKNITRQITNVAAGKEDTDAVNVAQLKAISSTMNTDIAASKTHFYSVNSTDEKAGNYDNKGATGDSALAAGVGARAEANHGIAIGTDAWSNEGDGRVKGSGDIAIGYKATIQNYVNQSGSIALGQNALIENTFGSTEKNYAFNQTTFTSYNGGFLPADADKEATGIAIGRNSFARTGSLMVGSHMYKGAIADMDEVDGTNSNTLLNRDFNNINMTTLGTNSFNSGTFATVTGSYSATTAKKKTQNFAATVNGSLNSIESYKDAADNSGVASSIVGTANRIANSNNTTILGAGNEVTNSLTDFTAPTEGGASAKALQDTLKNTLQNDTKGAVVISGIGNKVDSSHGVSVLGSKNIVNTTDNIQLLGDNREVTGATGSVIIGSADSKTPTSVKDATILGHNANVSVEGGVALGAGSVASREAQVAGYDPSTKAALTETSATWKATDAAVSVGKEDGSMTRQITGVAAGSKATDAVNVAQLQKALAGAKDGNDTLKSSEDALKLDGNKLSMKIEDTAGNTVSGSVDLSKFAQAVDTNTTYTFNSQENKDNNTTTITVKDSNGKENSVTVATKDTRNTVKAGENVSLDTKDNADGSHEYTVNVKADGKVEAGSTKIVSGDTVYKETRVKQDGKYVKASNTAGENLSVLDNQVASNSSNITNLNGRVNSLDSKVNKVGAGAAALAALHPLDFDPEDKWDFAVGYGNYRDANSVAVGAFYRPDDDTMFSLGTNFGNGENMINAGVSFKFGPKGKSQVRPGSTQEITELRATVARQDDQLKKQDNKLKEQDNEIKELKSMVQQLLAEQGKKATK